jgi:hypothetical protein
MPLCEHYGVVEVPAGSDLCSSCLDEVFAQAAEHEDQQRAKLRDYSGDQYLTDGWLEDGLALDEAKKIVEDTSYISMAIEMGLLENVLADKYATAVLRRCLIDRNPQILHALRRYAGRRKVRRKPGRKPKGREQLYEYEKVYNLHKSGLSLGQVARKIWGPLATRNLADAHYRRPLKHGYPPISRPGK